MNWYKDFIDKLNLENAGSNITVVSGDTSVGKSTFIQNLVYNNLINTEREQHYINLECNYEMQAMRLLEINQAIDNKPQVLDTLKAYKPQDMQEFYSIFHKAKTNADVYLDNIQLLSAFSHLSEKEFYRDVIFKIKQNISEKNIRVFIVAYLNRSNQDINLNTIKFSSEIVPLVDNVVMIISSDGDLEEKTQTQLRFIKAMKCRNASLFTIQLRFDKDRHVFKDT